MLTGIVLHPFSDIVLKENDEGKSNNWEMQLVLLKLSDYGYLMIFGLWLVIWLDFKDLKRT